jgi:Sec-independent protein translocase protein TatA
MNFFGVGGFEFLLIIFVALFFLGPKNLIFGIRKMRLLYTQLKKQRDELISIVTEAVEIEELKKLDPIDEIKKDIKKIESSTKLDQIIDEANDPYGSKNKDE